MEDREVSQDRQQGFTSFLKFKKQVLQGKKVCQMMIGSNFII